MYRDATVAVVVPAYNEEGFVGAVIDDLPGFVDRAYLVDDGSTDGTWHEIQRHAETRNRTHDGHFEELVVPIRHETNRGVGGAIKTGYQRAREEGIDVTAVLGGDDQMDPRLLTRYLDPIVDDVADYTKGNRFDRPEQWAGMPRFRLVGNVVLSYLTKVASGYWETMDSQNGYTAISLEALEATDIDGMYEYYGYCNDLLVRLNAAEMRVADVPRSSEYAYQDGWKSHIDYTEYVPRVSTMLLRSFLWRLRRKYLLTSFEPAGPLYLLGMAAAGASVLGLAKSLLTRDGHGGTWTLSTTTGVLTLFAAAMLDRAESTHLERRVSPDDDRRCGASTDDRHSGEESTDKTASPEQTDDDPSPAEQTGDGDRSPAERVDEDPSPAEQLADTEAVDGVRPGQNGTDTATHSDGRGDVANHDTRNHDTIRHDDTQ